MAKIDLTDVGSGYQSATKQNANNAEIEEHLNDKVLYRDNPDGETNTMQQELDMNSNDINNVRTLDVVALTIGGVGVIPGSDTVTVPTAASIPNVAAGNIAATDVQGAIDELDGEKVGIAGTETITGDKTFSGTSTFSGVATLTTPVLTTPTIADATGIVAASTTVEGVVEIADQTETDAGTDVSKPITPSTLANYGRLTGSGFSGGVETYIESDAGSVATVLDIDALISTTWETVGPTGSGATNEWAALDNIPLGATALILKLYNSVQGSTSSSSYTSTIYGRGNGSAAIPGTLTTLAREDFFNRSGALERNEGINIAYLPLDGSNMFQLYYQVGGTSPTSTAHALVVGYIG